MEQVMVKTKIVELFKKFFFFKNFGFKESALLWGALAGGAVSVYMLGNFLLRLLDISPSRIGMTVAAPITTLLGPVPGTDNTAYFAASVVGCLIYGGGAILIVLVLVLVLVMGFALFSDSVTSLAELLSKDSYSRTRSFSLLNYLCYFVFVVVLVRLFLKACVVFPLMGIFGQPTLPQFYSANYKTGDLTIYISGIGADGSIVGKISFSPNGSDSNSSDIISDISGHCGNFLYDGGFFDPNPQRDCTVKINKIGKLIGYSSSDVTVSGSYGYKQILWGTGTQYIYAKPEIISISISKSNS